MGDFASAIKRTIDHVYFIRQGDREVLLSWIEMANLTFKPRLATRFLDSLPGQEKASRSAAFIEWIRNALAARNRSADLGTSSHQGK
jgi:hypothetical protein